VDETLRQRAAAVRLLVLDVDGVLTDAGLYYGADGEVMKLFSARDGFAIKAAQASGIVVGVLTGRLSPPLAARLRDLAIPRRAVIEGSHDKGGDIERLATRFEVPLDQCAHIGDDLADLPALARVGLAACPADAVPEVRCRCSLVTVAPGGHGAVREVIETLLTARGAWQRDLAAWAGGGPPAGFWPDDAPRLENGEPE